MDDRNQIPTVAKPIAPEPVITTFRPAPAIPPKRLHVAAYARVSSGKDAMLHSLSAQVSYYSEYIQARPAWEYCGVYADADYTGTKESRPEFQRLLADCRAGKIDLVITKSVSRFARNTLTTLNTVRELKALGIDCYFEEDRIHSLSGEGELLLTLLACFAQEESLSASDNCKWKIRHGFQDGKPTYVSPFGYRMEKGRLIIIPEEAEIIKTIFALYLSGLGKNAIMKALRDDGVLTRNGVPFSESIIADILRNEKYAGDLLLQKTFSENHLTKRILKNNGELPSYYVPDAHEAIIDRDSFDRVQDEIERRAELAARTRKKRDNSPTRSLFTGLIECTSCGKHYRRKTAHGKAFWICTTFYKHGKSICQSKQIPEETLYAVTAEVLGLTAPSEMEIREALNNQVSRILVPAFNHLVYVFKDGSEIERVWQDRSRRDSWTDAMRREAAEKTRRAWTDGKHKERSTPMERSTK